MSNTTTYQTVSAETPIADIAKLVKMRLSSLVVLTAVGAYYVSSGLSVSLLSLVLLSIGGFGITGAANAINQVLEHQYDALMDRTKDRPIPAGRMSVSMAVLIAGFLCILGVTALATFNSLTAFFGMLAFVLYSFVYTPLKRYSRAAVFVGAIAGAMPMLIGVVAFDGEITLFALFLFLIQFAWQFPHFWSIAYISFDDYKNADFKFVPVDRLGDIDRGVAVSSVAYASLLIVVTGIMYATDTMGTVGLVSIGAMSFAFLFYAVQFWRYFDHIRAKQLMLSSLAYIPMFLLLIILDLAIG